MSACSRRRRTREGSGRTSSSASSGGRESPVRSPAPTSSKPLRDGVEPDRLLERMADAEEAVLAELRADELKSDGEPPGQTAWDREAGQACETRWDREEIARIHGERIRRLVANREGNRR